MNKKNSKTTVSFVLLVVVAVISSGCSTRYNHRDQGTVRQETGVLVSRDDGTSAVISVPSSTTWDRETQGRGPNAPSYGTPTAPGALVGNTAFTTQVVNVGQVNGGYPVYSQTRMSPNGNVQVWDPNRGNGRGAWVGTRYYPSNRGGY